MTNFTDSTKSGYFRIKIESIGKSFEDAIEKAYREEKFTDIALISGHDCGIIKAHKMILSNCSDYFKKVIECSNSLKLPHPVVPFIVIKEMSSSDLKEVIDFIYTGTLIFHESRIESLISMAQFLEMPQLKEALIASRSKWRDSKLKHSNLNLSVVTASTEKEVLETNEVQPICSANLKTLDIMSNFASDGKNSTLVHSTTNIENVSKSPVKALNETEKNSPSTFINVESTKTFLNSSLTATTSLSSYNDKLINERILPKPVYIFHSKDKILFPRDIQNTSQISANILKSIDLRQKDKPLSLNLQTDRLSDPKTIESFKEISFKPVNNSKIISLIIKSIDDSPKAISKLQSSFPNNQVSITPSYDLNSSSRLSLLITKPAVPNVITTITKQETNSPQVQITNLPDTQTLESKLDHNYSSMEIDASLNKEVTQITESNVSFLKTLNLDSNQDSSLKINKSKPLTYSSSNDSVKSLSVADSDKKNNSLVSFDSEKSKLLTKLVDQEPKPINTKSASSASKVEEPTVLAKVTTKPIASSKSIHMSPKASSKKHSIGILHRKSISTIASSSSPMPTKRNEINKKSSFSSSSSSSSSSCSSSSSSSSSSFSFSFTFSSSSPSSSSSSSSTSTSSSSSSSSSSSFSSSSPSSFSSSTFTDIINNNKKVASPISKRSKRYSFLSNHTMSTKSNHSSSPHTLSNKDVTYLGESSVKPRARKQFISNLNATTSQPKHPRKDYEDVSAMTKIDLRSRLTNSNWPLKYPSPKFKKELAYTTYEKRPRRATRSTQYSH